MSATPQPAESHDADGVLLPTPARAPGVAGTAGPRPHGDLGAAPARSWPSACWPAPGHQSQDGNGFRVEELWAKGLEQFRWGFRGPVSLRGKGKRGALGSPVVTGSPVASARRASSRERLHCWRSGESVHLRSPVPAGRGRGREPLPWCDDFRSQTAAEKGFRRQRRPTRLFLILSTRGGAGGGRNVTGQCRVHTSYALTCPEPCFGRVFQACHSEHPLASRPGLAWPRDTGFRGRP